MAQPWFRIDPLTRRKLLRFRQLKRGYVSFLILLALVLVTLFAELWVNNKALIVKYDGELYFPTYTGVKLGSVFGLEGVEGQQPVDYRALQEQFAQPGNPNWVVMPWIPYDATEVNVSGGVFRAVKPSWLDDDPENNHILGTDSLDRSIAARVVYGFRVAIFFALFFMIFVYLIGVVIGCCMGYFGGWFDLLTQRLIEIWSNIPFLYLVIIVYSVIPADVDITSRIIVLLAIMVCFSWTAMTYFMRTATYREKARDYVAAAQVLGAGTGRTIFKHLLPNTLSVLVTFIPFTMAGAITAVTALDFLGVGLPPPTPSIGELLKQGVSTVRESPWIAMTAFTTLCLILVLVTFVGEAIREAFDPKKFTLYE